MMIRLFLQSQQKKAQRRLSELHITSTSWREQTSFQELYYFVKSEINKPKQLIHCIEAMRKSQLAPENMLKFCCLIHIYVQNSISEIDVDSLQDFVAWLLERCPSVIEKYESNELKKDKSIDGRRGKSPNRSCNHSPMVSTRSQEIFVCKEIYMLTHIIRPYIGYLMKYFANQASLFQIFKKERVTQSHQAWMLINYLKLVTSITTNFTMIGRYFMTSYGALVVLLTKTLARDINKMMGLLSAFVSQENFKLAQRIATSMDEVHQFVNILEEISKVNDQLYTVYLGKYFVRLLLDIPQPKWIIANSKEFDAVYRAVKKIDKENAKEEAVKLKKRSKSVLLPSQKSCKKIR